MRILVSTTEGHNVGDRLILEGCKRLLRLRYGPDIEYVEFNRLPDLQEPAEPRYQRKGLVGNYWTPESKLLKYMDMVVLAGSPEWFGAPMQTLYKAISDEVPHIPMLGIGIGLGHRWGMLSKLDKQVLSRPETKLITRSTETMEMLRRDNIESIALPCPAVLAFDPWTLHGPRTADTSLIIGQKPGHGWHEVRESYLEGLEEAVSREAELLTIHVKEYEYFLDNGFNPMYAPTVEDFRRIVSQYDHVLSTRLHGAIGALSLGCRAAVIGDTDFRITTAAKMFGAKLPCFKNFKEAQVGDYFDTPARLELQAKYLEAMK